MQLPSEQSSPSEEYLSDYVYIDNLRLSHYYSQLSENGLITQSKRTFKETGKNAGRLQVKAMVVGGDVRSEVATEEALELYIDPSFSRPQETMDALYANGFVKEGLAEARLGTLVLAEGNISLFDIRLLRELWQHMGNSVAVAQTAHIANQKERERAAATAKKEFDQLASLIAKLPHSLQGSLSANGDHAWFTLDPKCMLLNPEDLAFKHGCDLNGSWHMLGIVDALPDAEMPVSTAPLFINSDIENALRLVLASLRAGFGRPPDRYGITPLVIFRTIKK